MTPHPIAYLAIGVLSGLLIVLLLAWWAERDERRAAEDRADTAAAELARTRLRMWQQANRQTPPPWPLIDLDGDPDADLEATVLRDIATLPTYHPPVIIPDPRTSEEES